MYNFSYKFNINIRNMNVKIKFIFIFIKLIYWKDIIRRVSQKIVIELFVIYIEYMNKS